METWMLSEEVFGCKCPGLLQGNITDRLRATTRNVRHNVKVFCNSNGLSHRCWHITCSTYMLVVCLQSGVKVRSYRNVTGRHDTRKCWTDTRMKVRCLGPFVVRCSYPLPWPGAYEATTSCVVQTSQCTLRNWTETHLVLDKQQKLLSSSFILLTAHYHYSQYSSVHSPAQ
jgi:hypothetical protein